MKRQTSIAVSLAVLFGSVSAFACSDSHCKDCGDHAAKTQSSAPAPAPAPQTDSH